MIEEVQENRRPIIITQNGEPRAVIQDLKTSQEQKDTILLLKMVALGEHEIKLGALLDQTTVFTCIEKRLKG